MGGCVANEQINTNQAMQYYNHNVKTQQRFKKVVSIAALWASGPPKIMGFLMSA